MSNQTDPALVEQARAAQAAAESFDAAWRAACEGGDGPEQSRPGSPHTIGLRDHAPNNADFREVDPMTGVH